jgi:hypothetical protein
MDPLLKSVINLYQFFSYELDQYIVLLTQLCDQLMTAH